MSTFSEGLTGSDIEIALKAAEKRDDSKEAHGIILRKASDDLLWFCIFVLGFNNLDAERHRPLADAALRLSRTPSGFGLFEDPRGTGKTSLITTGLAIQPNIAPPIPGTPWAGSGTCHIFASKRKVRSEQLQFAVMKQWQTNPLLRYLRPEIRMDPDKWSTTYGANLIRQSSSADYSYLSMGVDGGQAGPHCHLWHGDDFIDESNYFSPTEIARAIEFIRLSTNIVKTVRGTRIITQNQWVLFDVNHWLKDTGHDGYKAKHLKVFSRSMTACKGCLNGREIDKMGKPLPHAHESPIFPLLRWWPGDETQEKLTLETLAELRREVGDHNYASQYENDPVDPLLLKFRLDWLQPFDLVTDEGAQRAWITFTPPGELEPVRITAGDCYRVGMLDVGHDPKARDASRTAMVVVAFHKPTGCFFLLESWAALLEPLDGLKKAIETYLKWSLNRFGVEAVGYQKAIGPMLARIAREDYNIQRGLEPGKEGDWTKPVWLMMTQGNKDTNIELSLEPLGRSGRLFVLPSDTLFREEWRKFPMWNYKDLIDCMRYIPRLVKQLKRDERRHQNHIAMLRRSAIRRRMESGKDAQTGY